MTKAHGFLAGGVAAGIKESGTADIAMLVSEHPATAAAVFTRNVVQAAPLLVSRAHVADGHIQAVIVNAGNANCATGERGIRDARAMAQRVAERLSVAATEVYVNSTGIVGHYLPMDKVIDGIGAVSLTREGGRDFARAILTTDTFAKEAVETFAAHGQTYTLGGCAKGAGMIHPNMATMLAFVTTDAAVAAATLDAVLRRVVDHSFNMVTVDGDTSTNDSVLILANGAAGGPVIDDDDAEARAAFESALLAVCTKLAQDIARDGEGATKLLEVTVTGAARWEDARDVARSIVRSPLLKAALSKGDPNWGRALVAAGYAGVPFDPTQTRMWLGDLLVVDGGTSAGVPEPEAAVAVAGEIVRIRLDLGAGPAEATAWGCDLTEEYVRFNADYVT